MVIKIWFSICFSIQGRFREDSGKSQGRFREDSGKSQGRFRKESGKIQGRFRKESGKSQGRFRKESGKSQGRVREDSGKSQGRVRKESGKSQGRVREESGKSQGRVREESVGVCQKSGIYLFVIVIFYTYIIIHNGGSQRSSTTCYTSNHHRPKHLPKGKTSYTVLTGTPAQSKTILSCLGIFSYRYLFIQLNELRQRRVNELVQVSTRQRRILSQESAMLFTRCATAPHNKSHVKIPDYFDGLSRR